MRRWKFAGSWLALVALVVVSGCQPVVEPVVATRKSTQIVDATVAVEDVPSTTAVAPEPGEEIHPPANSVPVAAQVNVTPTAGEIPSLWTRTKGVDWPTFLGPTGDSKSPEQGILTEWPKEGLKIVWQTKLGEGYGIGSISRGRMYQADRVRDTMQLTCYNAETGELLWQNKYPTEYVDMYGYDGGPRCSPVVDGDRVYLLGVDGLLLCVKALDGKEVWKIDTNKQFGVVQNFFGVGSTPVVEGDVLICMVGGTPEDEQDLPIDRVGTNGTAIVAFNKHTGEVVYKFGEDLASYASITLATINNRRWGFAFCRAGLIGFEPRAGKQDFFYPWRAKSLESVNAATPVVVENEVFISETYGPGSSLLQVIPGDHRVVWADDDRKREKALQLHWNTPIHVDGYLYGSSGRHTENAELRCIEWKTGKVMWSEPGLTRCSLLHIDGHFICQGEYGQLLLIKVNPEKFDVVAQVLMRDTEAPPLFDGQQPPLLKYPAWAAPIVSHGLLYVRGSNRLVCLELIPEK
jgi:outer membrane protein assembly factor BamB